VELSAHSFRTITVARTALVQTVAARLETRPFGIRGRCCCSRLREGVCRLRSRPRVRATGPYDLGVSSAGESLRSRRLLGRQSIFQSTDLSQKSLNRRRG